MPIGTQKARLWHANVGVILTLSIGTWLLLHEHRVSVVGSIVLLIIAVVFGAWQCRRLTHEFGLSFSKKLECAWLIKILLSLAFVSLGWLHEIDRVDTIAKLHFSYDPIRYFFDAIAFLDNNWRHTTGSNSTGILYYYGLIFFVFGNSPFTAALFNNLVTLLVVLFVIRCLSEFRKTEINGSFLLILLVAIPDSIWFDSITSREGICTSLILLVIFAVRSLIYSKLDPSEIIKTTAIALFGLSLLLLIRSTTILPILVLIFLTIFFLKLPYKISNFKKICVVLLLIGALFIRPLVVTQTASFTSGWLATLETLTSFDKNIAANSSQWNEKSIGRMLAPNNGYEAVIFSLPRMFVYLVAPLPNIPVTMQSVSENRYSLWQNLCALLTAASLVIIFPLSIAGLVQSIIRRKHESSDLFIHLGFWLVWLSIAGGNIIIQERYRLMMTPLLIITAWLGWVSCSTNLIKRCVYGWFLTLSLGVVFFYLYKNFR
jgi:hypothetical protein